MKVMIVVKANAQSEAGEMPSTELLTKMGKYNQELVAAGIMLSGDGLKASSNGARVKFDGDKRTVTNGPFANTKDLIAGYWIWNVKSLQDAIDWLKRAPFTNGEEVEIRPIFSAEDFAPQMTPDLQKQEADLRQKLAASK